MNRSDLIREVAIRSNITLKTAAIVVNDVFEAISQELAEHGSVQIPHFGTFTVEDRTGRKYINPKTKVESFVGDRKYPYFTSAQTLKDLVR